jgi:ribose 5-phosphate isomerase B
MSGADRGRISELVRQSLQRALQAGSLPAAPAAPAPARADTAPRTRAAAEGALTESHLIDMPVGSTVDVPAGTLVTPAAREWALFRRIELVEQGATTSLPAPSVHPPPGGMVVAPARRLALGADHGGFAMKEALRPFIQSLGFTVEDCGPASSDAVDYPDFARAVAMRIAEGACGWGVMIDGAGIGSCMAANKVPGVLAAHCYDLSTAVNAREHNDANYLTLGAGLTGPGLAKQIVKTFLRTAHGGGRHAKRVDKIRALDNRPASKPRK